MTKQANKKLIPVARERALAAPLRSAYRQRGPDEAVPDRFARLLTALRHKSAQEPGETSEAR